jgi:hypothetical protein
MKHIEAIKLFFLEIFRYISKQVRHAITKRVYSFNELWIKFLANKNRYFLNLIGYYDGWFKKFLKIITLYFLLKFMYDLLSLIIYIIYEFYLIFVEIIFNCLYDIAFIFEFLKKYAKIFIFIEKIYIGTIRWFYNFFTLYKIKQLFMFIRNFSVEKSFYYIVDSIYLFLSNVLWFFFVRKQTRKKYLIVKKLIVRIIYFIVSVAVSIWGILVHIFYISPFYFYYYYKGRYLNFYKWPRARTKKRLALLLFFKFLKKFIIWFLHKNLRVLNYFITIINKIISFKLFLFLKTRLKNLKIFILKKLRIK